MASIVFAGAEAVDTLMVHTQPSEVRTDRWLPPLLARPPAWVTALVASAPAAVTAAAHAALSALHVGSADGVTYATVSILDAAHLAAPALELAVTDAYQALAGVLTQAGCHPVRFWNFIPGIHAAMDVDSSSMPAGDPSSNLHGSHASADEASSVAAAEAHPRDRYMVFNAGRFAAFASAYGSPAAFSRSLPTASAVGVREGPLVIHALGLETAGAPLENPRQVPAYSYSRRYGPLPPCFARATLVQVPREERPWLLVGGTASILGEDSIHMRDPRRQAVETFENLARLVESGRSSAGCPDRSDPLSAFRELRVYVVREQDADLLRAMVEERFPAGTRVEYAQADLCRQELLVEIEGLATL
jgi:chorismate lyase/3-hydroxybenzoate synthase